MIKPYKKAQFGIEFVILITFMLIVFLGFFGIITYKLADLEEEGKQQAAANIALLVDNEVKLAKSSNNGYERVFEIPSKIEGSDYNISIIGNREVVVAYPGYEHILFLPPGVEGNVSSGLNNITKTEGIVYLQGITPECNNGEDDDGDTYLDSADPGCYINCDYVDAGNFRRYRHEADSCSCSSVGQCCSGAGFGSYYGYFDGDCGGGQCWSACSIGENVLLIMRNLISNVIRFENDGDVILKGQFQDDDPNPPVSDDDEFIFKDRNGITVAVINLGSGDMFINGSKYENQPALTPSPTSNDFIVKDSSGEVMYYIDETGNLYLKGTLTDNGNP